jgi:O-antigen ligase
MLILCLLAVSIVTLAILGAGVFPGVLSAIAALLCLGCLLFQGSANDRAGQMPVFTVGIVAFLVLTIMPLPAFLDFMIGHARISQNNAVRAVLKDAAMLGLADKSHPMFALSRNGAGTMRMILLAISGFAAAALSSRLPGEWKEKYLFLVVVIAALVAAGGYISQHIVPQGKYIWWYFPVPHGAEPVACFVNRNHFGGFTAMLCPAAVIFFLENLTRKKFLRALFAAACFATLAFATIMSLSRGAWIAFLASMLAVDLLLLVYRRFVPAIGVFAVLCGVLYGVTQIPDSKLYERLGTLSHPFQTDSAVMRMSTWNDSLQVIANYPFVGTGMNGFRMIFPQYRSATTRKSFANAENEYVQLPVELGIVGLALALGLCLCVVRRWHANSAHGGIGEMVQIGVAGAVIAVAVHACLDFALRVPLYFVVFASLAGLVISSSGDSVDASKDAAWRPRRIGMPLTALLVVLLISCHGMKVYNMDSSDFLEAAKPPDLCRALVMSPTSWQAWYQLGVTAIGSTDSKMAAFGERCIACAAFYDPNNYRLWEPLAKVRLRLNDVDGALAAYGQLKTLRSWVQIPDLDDVLRQRSQK